MAITNGQFERLSDRVNEAVDRIGRLEGQIPSGRAPRPHSATLLLSAIGIIVTIIGSAVTVTQFVVSKFGQLESRLTKAEGAIKALADQEPKQTQNLIHDLLADAVNPPKNSEGASIRIVVAAASLTRSLRDSKSPAPEQFFDSSIGALNRIPKDAESAVFEARVAFAEYRSAINPVPSYTITASNPPMRHAIILHGGSGLEGGAFDASSITGSFIEPAAPPPQGNRMNVR